jgi:hypothetical protein
MKVDNPRVNQSHPVQPAAADVARSSAKAPGSSVSDAVSLSASLRLADQAVRAAAVSERVRPEAVAKGRALLAAGQLGANVDRLAERIINHLTQSSDDDPS